jgi:hypothetical protein
MGKLRPSRGYSRYSHPYSGRPRPITSPAMESNNNPPVSRPGHYSPTRDNSWKHDGPTTPHQIGINILSNIKLYTIMFIYKQNSNYFSIYILISLVITRTNTPISRITQCFTPTYIVRSQIPYYSTHGNLPNTILITF